MLFRQLILHAIFWGLLAGLGYGVLQHLTVTPLILEAEQYEVAEEPILSAASVHEGDHHSSTDHHGGHHHDSEAWAPADGLERTGYTLASNMLAGIGYAAVLMALMVQAGAARVGQSSKALPFWGQGALWGAAGFTALFLMPALGMPPEIPGAEAATIESRQLWWTGTVVASIVALALLTFAPLKWKALSLILLAAPFIVGAPHLLTPMFSHPDPVALESLHSIHEQFVLLTGLTNAVFWVALGVLSAWVVQNKLLPAYARQQSEQASA